MKRLLTLLLLAAGCGILFAEDATEPEFGFEGPRIFGADFGLKWGTWKLTAGGGWEAFSVGRDLTTGSPLAAEKTPASYMLVDGVVRLKNRWTLPEADLWVASGVLGHVDPSGEAPRNSFQTDLTGGLFAFFQAGATRNQIKVNAHQVVSGHWAEVSVESGPAFLSLRSTDYYKIGLNTSVFLPLWDLEGKEQLFSGTLALRANAQWIDGASVPLLLREWTEVRGYNKLLDTRFRSVGTAELRMGMPSLWGAADLVPVLLIFGEGGWYSGYSGAPTATAGGSGVLASVGAGFGLTLWGLTTPTVTWALPLTEESALWWTVGFNYKF